ncbi:MAG: efflux RND transporter periplasmic adaptor subunit, partial [Candidatus Eremiobacteraeota bacterium]|nr:efflux RND transporter periplasmic adaptor subunit [Candidatus Eremiobacteraeota bacterium]
MNRVVGLTALAAIALAACSSAGKTQTTAAQPQVSLATAQFGTFERHVSAVGHVGVPGTSETKLSFPESGILSTVNVHVGDAVSAGEPLATLDTSGLSLVAQQAQADASSAAANAQQSAVDKTSAKIAMDEAALRRAESLYAAGVSAHKDVEAARAQLAADRAEAASASAGIRSANAQAVSANTRAAIAQRDLANATLRAPADGIVVAVLKRRGEAVDPTTPVVSIGPPSTNQTTLSLAPADVARVRVGNRVHVSVVGTQVQGDGRVSGISPVLDPTTQTATVVVTGLPSGVAPGSYVQATIAVGTLRGVLVPQTAIVQDPQSGDTLVFVS